MKVTGKGDAEMGRWGDGEMGRWGDGEMGRWGDLTRVGILHCREGKTWGTRKDSGQGRKTVQNHILLVTKRPLCGENLPCLLSLLVFLVLP
ncbi:hypothetical protein [Anabaena lutea]|uniref:Uncharacterized protein n=1 Tax=Anabaena lutea FACHB-196 TaxID=2692881 RepID=A0ABR8FNC0_9NOST|nr:hypothetical protein [Anabaena lutea]MBD2570221.1 hypothetical protein [Anabaena lutea FACHB-196]